MFFQFRSTVLFLVTTTATFILQSQAQQTYVDNKQLDCQNNDTTTLGYICNAAPTCQSYLTFRSQPPLYNTPTAIATLLNSNPHDVTSINNFTSTSFIIPADTAVIVPISNCSCSDGGNYYQHNASYVLRVTGESYYSIANITFQGLTTCQALINQNPYDFLNLLVGDNITIPLRCACPTANQTAAGVRYLLTYLIESGDTIDYISQAFGGVDIQRILDANEITLTQVIKPYNSILVPLTTEPTRINVSVTPPSQPSPPVIPIPPSNGGSSSNKWVFIGVGIGVGLLVLVSVFGVLFWFSRKKKVQQTKTNNLPQYKNSVTVGLIGPESNSLSISTEGLRIAIESVMVYKYEDLQRATGEFTEDNRVKGSVYKGVFNGDLAVVKIMKGDVAAEINMLQLINHSKVIRLSGFCLHQGNTYLVYEFAENGSLGDWLHAAVATKNNTRCESVLDWKQRVQIAHDVSDALNYLHNFITPPYIHKNLTSSNVLIDANMRAKITNFGLARSVDENDNGELQLTRHVVGTFGYMPPEYIENGLITPKMDVFALGVLMSELLSGKEAATRSPEDGGDKKDDESGTVVHQWQLSETIKEVVGGDNVRNELAEFMDGRLRGEYPMELAYSMAKIASKCVAADLNDRPSVTEVFMTLSQIMSSSLDWDPSNELEDSRSLSLGR